MSDMAAAARTPASWMSDMAATARTPASGPATHVPPAHMTATTASAPSGGDIGWRIVGNGGRMNGQTNASEQFAGLSLRNNWCAGEEHQQRHMRQQSSHDVASIGGHSTDYFRTFASWTGVPKVLPPDISGYSAYDATKSRISADHNNTYASLPPFRKRSLSKAIQVGGRAKLDLNSTAQRSNARIE
jgi:hypothetical protein